MIVDGMGDLPCRQLNDMTPLEAAKTPNLDFLASRGKLGYMFPVSEEFAPESDEAIVSIFGNNLLSSSRGQLEARGTELKLVRGDLALRVNFATIDSFKEGNILDRRVGRNLTTEEAQILAKAINSKITLPCKFFFQPTIQHRGVLIFKGGFSEEILGNDSTYMQGKSQKVSKVIMCKPIDKDDENAQYTSNIVNEFIEKAYEVLNNHSVNITRKKRGFLPANYLLVRGAGIEEPKLKKYKKWMSVAYMPLEIGFSKTSGMKVFSFKYPELKKLDAYENLYEGLKEACEFSTKTLKKNYEKNDYAYIHIKETDLPGHDNKPVEKKLMIEYLDSTLFKFLKEFALKEKVKILVTADHSTPCKIKEHSADPVPVLLYDDSPEQEKKFCEKTAMSGEIGKIFGKELFKKTGFDK